MSEKNEKAIDWVIELGVFFLSAWAVVWLWNHTMPELLGVPMLTFWLGVKLCLLCRFLFPRGRLPEEA